MWIFRIVGMVLLTILTSFYFFPFEFTFLPSINTKMAMAGIGVVVLVIQLARGRKSVIDRDFFQLSLIAGLVSLIGLFAVTWNDTYDYTYATYIVSMWVWLSGAYVVTQAITKLHGHISVELVCNYLIVVCLAQCLIAFAMTQYLPLKNFVDSFLGSTGFMGKMEDRMYGIGASLDVAGSRFSVILVMIISILLKIAATDKKKCIGLYWVAFFVITIIGNMMSRTTTVGVIVALAYLFYVSRIYTLQIDSGMRQVLGWFVGILCAVILLVTYGYHTNPGFQENLRFGFEGFFSLVEKGRWEVHSNEILQNMYVFPDNLKTWFIGDGYFDNPYYADPYYTGPKWGGFYKGTDVGYLRFIFYFGLMGLMAFCFFMCRVAKVCMNRFVSYRSLFGVILLLNFAVWFKVSSDIFLVFALFLCINEEDNRMAEQKSLSSKFAS